MPSSDAALLHALPALALVTAASAAGAWMPIVPTPDFDNAWASSLLAKAEEGGDRDVRRGVAANRSGAPGF